ncbi:MAG: radical SAM protein [Deltaproteobacteria bacterium]|nr:radical SAM protein [Deltaproteobacteria bacterium]
MSRRRVVAILGVTGRLGPAVARAFAGWEVRGLSRRAAHSDEAVESISLVLGDRRRAADLAPLLEGADVVVDLLCFGQADADVLLEALAGLPKARRHLVFASSIAARFDEDDYGRGKRAAETRYAQAFDGPVHTLILPRLVASVDHARREQAYLESAASTGRALHAGSGRQRQTIAPVAGVAQLIRELADDAERVPPGPINVGPPETIAVEQAVAALVAGAGLKVPTGRHPDANWRGPHGGGDERLDVTRSCRLLELSWPDPIEVYRELGAWLAAHPTGKRPRPVVRKPSKRFSGRRVVDVHGRRRVPVLAEPHPEIEELARWLSPAFYVDTGRPCNSACVYCAVPPHGDTQGFTPLERLEDAIAAGRAAGCERAILIGGEPTIYPQLEGLLDALSAADLRDHVLMTNGLRLAEPGLVEWLVERGVRTFHVSIDSADESTYDRISRSLGQAPKQWEALDHVLAHPRARLYVYTAVTRLNAPAIPQLLDAIAEHASALGRPTPPSILAFVKPIGDALSHADMLLLAPEERAAIAREALAAAEKTGCVLGLRNLQACLAPELVRHLVDYYLEDYSVDIVSGEPEENAHAAYWSHDVPCEACAHRRVCSGVYHDDIERFGVQAFDAIGPESLDPAVIPPSWRPLE